MQLLCNCSSYFYKKAVIGRVSWMLLCGKYLLRTTTIAIHLEATVPHGELRAACRSWRGPGEVMFSSSSPWKTTAERGQTNFVSSICLTGSVSQLGKQHTRARTAPLPRTRSKKNLHLQGPNAACSRGTAAWQLGSLLGDGREQGRWAGLLHRMRTQASGVNLAPCERHCAQTFAAKHVNWDLLAPGSLPFPARYPGGACMGYLSQRSGTGKVCSSESLFTGMPMLRLNVNILKEKRDPPVCSLSLAAKPCFA